MKSWLSQNVKKGERGKPIISCGIITACSLIHSQRAELFMTTASSDSLFSSVTGMCSISSDVLGIRTSHPRKRFQNIPSPSGWNGTPPGLEDPSPLVWAERDRRKKKKLGFISSFRIFTHRQKQPNAHTPTRSTSWQAVSDLFWWVLMHCSDSAISCRLCLQSVLHLEQNLICCKTNMLIQL